MKNIVLTGFMGTGKTSVGREISRLTGFPFFDTDSLIEKRANLSIGEIFQQQGEPQFRQLEREILRELSPLLGVVIATGGGALLDPENLSIVDRNGLIFCLTADLETILERIGDSPNRPLLPQVKTLYKERELLYQKLPHLVDTSPSTPEETALKILEIYEKECKGENLGKRIYDADPD